MADKLTPEQRGLTLEKREVLCKAWRDILSDEIRTRPANAIIDCVRVPRNLVVSQ